MHVMYFMPLKYFNFFRTKNVNFHYKKNQGSLIIVSELISLDDILVFFCIKYFIDFKLLNSLVMVIHFQVAFLSNLNINHF